MKDFLNRHKWSILFFIFLALFTGYIAIISIVASDDAIMIYGWTLVGLIIIFLCVVIIQPCLKCCFESCRVREEEEYLISDSFTV